MTVQHRDLAAGRWWELSLAEQLGNVGSEVSRAARSTAASLQRYFDAYALAARASPSRGPAASGLVTSPVTPGG